MTELAETVASWPLAVSIAAAATVRGLIQGRRRTALNEALHELRRPLQSLVLATGPGVEPRLQSSAQLAAVALERLDREINGGGTERAREVFAARPLLESAVNRWRSRATLAGGSLVLRWQAGEVRLDADRFALAQALDNLIVNAIEHGGPAIAVEAHSRSGRLRVTVSDSGRARRPESRRGAPFEIVTRLAGRRRRGHGLAVVRRVATAHAGRFVFDSKACGAVAVLELPLAGKPGTGSAA